MSDDGEKKLMEKYQISKGEVSNLTDKINDFLSACNSSYFNSNTRSEIREYETKFNQYDQDLRDYKRKGLLKKGVSSKPKKPKLLYSFKEIISVTKKALDKEQKLTDYCSVLGLGTYQSDLRNLISTFTENVRVYRASSSTFDKLRIYDDTKDKYFIKNLL